MWYPRRDRSRWMSLLGATLGVVLTACGGSGATGGTSSGSEPQVTLKYSCPCTDQQPQAQAMTRFADQVHKATNGAVTIQVFTNGSLLSQNVEFQALQKGSTDIADTDPAQYAPQVAEMQIYLTPYLFTKWSQVEDTFKSSDGQKLTATALQKLGIRQLDIQDLGARELNLSITKTIKTPADMKGVRLRMPPGPYWAKLGQALGAQVTPVAFNEIYLALQTGTVQGQDNPVASDVANKFYEVTKQVVLTNHVFSAVFPTINEKSWQKLSASEQKAMVKAMQEADQWADQQVQGSQDDGLKLMEQNGLKVYSPDTAAFQKAVLTAFICDPSYKSQLLPGMLEAVEKSTKAQLPSC